MQFFFRMGRVTGAVLLLIFLGSCSLFTIPSTPGKKGSVSGATNSKRGIAFNLSQKADLDVLTAGAGGISWWYNWGEAPALSSPQDGAAYYPMIWGNPAASDITAVAAYLAANPSCKYLLLINEPNLPPNNSCDMTPAQVAQVWPQFETLAQTYGVQLVGPAMNYGSIGGANPENPVAWLDDFFVDYYNLYGHDPEVDAIAFHWYDYGLDTECEAIHAGTSTPHGLPEGKAIWVTEFANWDPAITTVAGEEAWMQQMVSWMESTPWIIKYAWFSGRNSGAPYANTDLLGSSPGSLTALGQYYLSLNLGD